MPRYSYLNTKTNEEIELDMSMSDMETYEKKNKHMQRIWRVMHIGDPVSLGITRPPSDFQKFVLGKVKAKNPRGSVEKRWNITKEI